MKGYSTEIAAIVVAVATPMLARFLTESCANEVAAYLPVVAAGAYLWFKRVSRGDVNVAGFRK